MQRIRYAPFRVLITTPDSDESILCCFEFLTLRSTGFLWITILWRDLLSMRKSYFVSHSISFQALFSGYFIPLKPQKQGGDKCKHKT